MGDEFPITAISGDSGLPIFPLEIDEHDQLGAKDTKRERSVTEAYTFQPTAPEFQSTRLLANLILYELSKSARGSKIG